MPDRILPALAALSVAALFDVAAHRCAGAPPTVTFVLIVALAFPLLLARRAASGDSVYAETDKSVYLGMFRFGVAVVAAAAVLSFVDAHKRPFGMYAGATFAVLFAAYLVRGRMTSRGFRRARDAPSPPEHA